ncbi:hypothetical protein HKB16_29455, partial [Vibrio parahaemolyticus]|nr:hypothetical protein [Vibrio parahaemolyticus]
MKYLNLLILSMLTAGCSVSKPYRDEKMYDLASQFKDLAQTVDGCIKFGEIMIDSGAHSLESVS